MMTERKGVGRAAAFDSTRAMEGDLDLSEEVLFELEEREEKEEGDAREGWKEEEELQGGPASGSVSPERPSPITTVQAYRIQKAVRENLDEFLNLGTSMPINIPHYSVEATKGNDSEDGNRPQAPATFVPPHLLEEQHHQTLLEKGLSVEHYGIKRERLRCRAAILRSTGFLEPTKPVKVVSKGSQVAIPQGLMSKALSPTLSGVARP